MMVMKRHMMIVCAAVFAVIGLFGRGDAATYKFTGDAGCYSFDFRTDVERDYPCTFSLEFGIDEADFGKEVRPTASLTLFSGGALLDAETFFFYPEFTECDDITGECVDYCIDFCTSAATSADGTLQHLRFVWDNAENRVATASWGYEDAGLSDSFGIFDQSWYGPNGEKRAWFWANGELGEPLMPSQVPLPAGALLLAGGVGLLGLGRRFARSSRMR